MAAIRTIPYYLRLRLYVSLAFVWFGISQCQSQYRPPQVEITEQDTVGYTFIKQDDNAIENRTHLEPVFQKLYEQRVHGGQSICIVHIGDSHILGNFLTQEVRKRLQTAFGDAGRGLIFPYKMANSNGPRDFLAESSCRSWKGSHCVKIGNDITPYGLTGFNLENSNPNCSLTFRLRDTTTSETQLFTKVTVYYRKTPGTFDLDISDEVSHQKAQLYLTSDYSGSFYFDRPVGQFTVSPKKTDPAQKNIVIDGISLENELSGVVYHSLGVNGAQVIDFANAKYFADQLGDLSPDLVILSFGTNEAQGSSGPASIYNNLQNITRQILEKSPGTRIMLTTPADSYLRGKGLNPYMGEVSKMIRKFAEEKGYALWDMYKLTGGENSCQLWKSNGLMSADSVHYSKLGYAVQGKLLYQSIVKGYNDYVEEKP